MSQPRVSIQPQDFDLSAEVAAFVKEAKAERDEHRANVTATLKALGVAVQEVGLSDRPRVS